MKRIIKKSTTITEFIKDNEGKEYIIDRKYDVNISTELIKESEGKYQILSESSGQLEEWIKKDKYFREEIAKEVKEYYKKNPSPQKEEELLEK